MAASGRTCQGRMGWVTPRGPAASWRGQPELLFPQLPQRPRLSPVVGEELVPRMNGRLL